LFRTYAPAFTSTFESSIRIRLAESADADILWEINEAVWETADEVSHFIDHQYVFVYEMENQIMGFGIFSPVIPSRSDFDIGMLVKRPFRGRGYGTGIIHHLARHCQSHGWRPICGCDIRNIASWRCLEKAGFRGDYRLLLFELI
jgi:RimJ/RimL family protein N-acetyltransferase